jgi:hypothetical protein
MTEDPPSFFRRWRAVILIGVPLIVVIVAVREFVDHRANSPILYPHSAVINEMALTSPLARQRLEQYYAKHQRQTVASKHYPWLCNEMQKLLAEDGLELVWLPEKRSLACPIPFSNLYEKP